jgi:hypothetical protein
VWDGLYDDQRGLLCNGLISDWGGWQKEKGQAFNSLVSVIEVLSPSKEEKIEVGELTRIGLDDPRDIPTLRMPYGQSVPVLFASAGIRRIMALAYLLVWSWEEHQKASRLLDQETTSQAIFLIDEIEAHLHPKWQRRIVSSLLKVAETLPKKADVQLITATHSPVLMVSVEPLFNPEEDAWFDLDLVTYDNGEVRVELSRPPFIRQGDVSRWLTSKAFDMSSARSPEAEEALEEAAHALSDEAFEAGKARELDTKLRRLLGDTDPFWMRWSFVAEKRGWLE